MADNRSLDEFLGGDGSDEPAREPDGPDGGPVEGDAAATEPTEADPVDRGSPAEPDAAPEAVEPLAETVAWSPNGGGECAACGATAEERWRDGDALVCGDCKAW